MSVQPLKSASSARLAPLRALVADDNEGNRQLLGAILRSQDLEVEVANCGRSAVTVATGRRFDLILLDQNMPQLDGLTATRLIREHETVAGWPRASIFIVTSMNGPADAVRSRAAGADQHVTKPVDLGGLIALVERARRAALTGARCRQCLAWVGEQARALRSLGARRR
ncbi:response regulator [Phenylobacterium sp.]|uniref:response regulator n=1 Tax=Phenylobacterium sp. TaxID=1871053 RepID=UPI002717B65C|nr:response regulator [Phenylobacterium sp.]MDO8379751.1 response regulator [Phenylobacterium sp.]